MDPTIVSGAVSTLSDLGKDEAWLTGWLREQPTRLGLGELQVEDTPAAESGAEHGESFLATHDGKCFSVDVQLGELDASHGFGVLDAWARNRARLPEKEHVAVLVTESTGDRYRTTLETLTGHLPLIVVELALWRGENEAILVPHVALASDLVDLSTAPATASASALGRVKAAKAGDASRAGETAKAGGSAKADPADEADEPVGTAEATAGDRAEGQAETDAPALDKDDTGVADPWGLPTKEAEAVAAGSTPNGSRLFTKFNT